MRKWLKKCVASLCAATIAFSGMYIVGIDSTKEVQADGEYKLVWSDEFDGTELNRNNWTVEVNGNGGGNNELQYYVDNTKNLEVSNGTLKIHALRENYANKSYTSGRINSKGKQEFKYGKIEARMKLPRFSGIWPAFWTLGANYNTVGWPKCGEMDIMEAINDNNAVFANLHWSYKNTQADTKGKTYDVGDRTQWHTYGMEWDENSAAFYVDGYVYEKYSISTQSEMEEFRKAQFIILNLAVGGQLPGYNINQNSFPATMEVDWVRVYQKPEEETTKYTGPTITVDQDAMDEYTGSWTSFFGQDWCGTYGNMTVNGAKVTDGVTVNVTNAGNIQGDSQWSAQANIEGLKYYPGNEYTLKCTLLSSEDKKVFIKIAGQDEEAISGEYITLTKNIPYNYEKKVYVEPDYTGKLDFKIGLGRSDGDPMQEGRSFSVKINNLAFTTTAVIPDPSYAETTTKSNGTSTTKNSENEATNKNSIGTTTTGAEATTNQNGSNAEVSNTGVNSDIEQQIKSSTSKIVSVKSKKKRSVKIIIKKQSNVTGYVIKYSTNKKYFGYNTKLVKKNIYRFKKLRSNKKYYFKVRAYVKQDGRRIYGKWSKSKKVKVK